MLDGYSSVVVLGGSGLLGSAFVDKLDELGIKVHAPSSGHLDIASLKDVESYINKIRPDVVVNCAALTNLEACEVDQYRTYEVNSIGAYNVALACSHLTCKYVFISSTGIYGEVKLDVPYTENDDPKPINTHHRSKLAAEIYVREVSRDFLILRVGWLFGASSGKLDFVRARLLEADRSNEIVSNSEQFGSPTYTSDVVEQAIMLINHKIIGTFNCVNNGEPASREDYVRAIYNFSRYDVCVKGCVADYFGRKVRVSNNESAHNFKLSLMGYDHMPHWKDSLLRYIQSLESDHPIDPD
jgi:dTDP-4-dehydrorhamnose reductase